MLFLKRTVPVLVVVLALMLVSLAYAQANIITYGQAVTGSITTQSPLAIYAFQGTQGDLVKAQVIGLSPAMKPNMNLLSPTGEAIATSAGSVAEFGTDAEVSARLPVTGVYSLIVTDVNSNAGEFIVRLGLRGNSNAPPLPISTPFSLPVETPSQLYSFTADPALPTVLTISTAESASFALEVLDSEGRSIIIIAGLAAPVFSLPPGGIYYVFVTNLNPGITVNFVVNVESASVSSPLPNATPPPASVGTCQAVTNGPVNVRSGPGTQYGVISQLAGGQSAAVTGINSGWYSIILPGTGIGWISSSVVTLQGDCSAIPFAPYTPDITPTATGTLNTTITSTSTATRTYTATNTPPPGVTYTLAPPTATYTVAPPTPTLVLPTLAPTEPATATSTTIPPTTTPPPPTFTSTVAVPTAPPDAQFNAPLNIPLDSTASSTDFVSYPDGDQVDRVRYDITGMNPTISMSGGRARLIISVSCFGTGTQNLQISTGGQTFSCGQTIVDKEVTFDTRTGSVTITATGGTNTYVQWVLTGTATSIN